MLKSSRWTNTLIFLSITGILVARFYLAITRYLDVDEFAHLHWTYLITLGYLPYKDFFLYHIPFFQWLLVPLFLLPPGWYLVIMSRLIIWVVYGANAFMLFQITKKITENSLTAYLSSLFVLVFPMTFDKSLEVRPDHMMVFFSLISILILVDRKRLSNQKLFFAGISIGLALLSFPKILFAAPAVLWLILIRKRNIYPFITGIITPLVLVFIYFVMSGILSLASHAIISDSVAVNAGKRTFSLLLAVSPYPLVYVSNAGPSWPWIVNTALWILGVTGLGVLWKQGSKNYTVFFFLFFIGALIFLYFFPAPYLQYFLPLSYFASVLAAISISAIERRFHALSFLVIAMLIPSFYAQYTIRADTSNNNSEQKQVVANILKISEPTDTVYDMVGSYIFRPDGYYICCHPYAEFVDRLSIKVPTLRNSLMGHRTKFVILDRTGQSLWKPKREDLDFLLINYVPSKYPKIYVLKSQENLLQ